MCYVVTGQVSPMSILACLGRDAESIRDMFLTRLEAVSEDIQLKVGILELLSVCVDSQPGLIEIFLNVQTQHGDSARLTVNKPNLKLGRNSCLPVLLKLMEQKRQFGPHCPPELLAACMELVHALWAGLRETPMAVLRKNELFWPSVVEPLKMSLPVAKEGDPVSAQASKVQSKICAFSMRTIALEIFAMSGTSLNANFEKNLKETFTGERLMYWSKTVRQNLEAAGQAEPSESESSHEQSLWDHPGLNLLLAWKNFLITAAKFKVEGTIQMTDSNKAAILHNLLEGVRAQFKVGQLSELKVKLASISSALFFTLLKIWGRELCDKQLTEFFASPRTVSTPAATLGHLTQALNESMGGETLIPSVLIGLLGSASLILQNCGQRLDSLQSLLHDLLPGLCSVFLRSSWTLPALLDNMDKNKDGVADQGSGHLAAQFGVQVKLQITCCCLMVEVLHNSQDLNSALKVLQEQGILSSVLATTEAFFKSRQGISYVYSSLLLLTKIAESEMGASMLVNSNLTSHLCLVLTTCYTREDSFQPRNLLAKAFSTTRPATVSWHTLYCLSLDLFAACLRMLGHAFLEDALNLVGVHQDRMQQSLELARVTLNHHAQSEAESTCNFLMQLCRFQREWNFHLPHVMAKLMSSSMAMIQMYVALLIRPRYLLHLLEHTKAGDANNDSKMLLQIPAHLQHQTSLDDVDQPTRSLVDAQHRILKLVVKALLCVKCFTPVLPEILLDQSVDVSEWEPVLQLSFGTPSLDGDVSGFSFGTLLNCVTACIRMLTRADRSVSPHRASPDPKQTQAQVPRPVLQLTLELSLEVLLSQACRYLRDPTLTPRDRQFLKRELGTELNSCLSPLNRPMRRSGGAGDKSFSLTPPPGSGTSGKLVKKNHQFFP
ncbi:nucleoporin NUP188 [Elysia marginata]|uniref:Nucleoporin NUP188 n=1 Tax=Elysia marginata TaxID=1093978 RepID=A0AAV4I2T9_9GAST|nr:nucleoporin NUP188 [Elysia marginata]